MNELDVNETRKRLSGALGDASKKWVTYKIPHLQCVTLISFFHCSYFAQLKSWFCMRVTIFSASFLACVNLTNYSMFSRSPKRNLTVRLVSSCLPTRFTCTMNSFWPSWPNVKAFASPTATHIQSESGNPLFRFPPPNQQPLQPTSNLSLWPGFWLQKASHSGLTLM